MKPPLDERSVRQHQVAINRARSAKRPFSLITFFTNGRVFYEKTLGVPNFMPHMEALVQAVKEQREFFVYADFCQRYLSREEFQSLCDESEENQ